MPYLTLLLLLFLQNAKGETRQFYPANHDYANNPDGGKGDRSVMFQTIDMFLYISLMFIRVHFLLYTAMIDGDVTTLAVMLLIATPIWHMFGTQKVR